MHLDRHEGAVTCVVCRDTAACDGAGPPGCWHRIARTVTEGEFVAELDAMVRRLIDENELRARHHPETMAGSLPLTATVQLAGASVPAFFQKGSVRAANP